MTRFAASRSLATYCEPSFTGYLVPFDSVQVSNRICRSSWRFTCTWLTFIVVVAAVGQVSVLYDAKALLGEGPQYICTTSPCRDELVWVGIEGKIQLNARVGAPIPCEDDSNKLIAVIEREICIVHVVDRESGQRKLYAWHLEHYIVLLTVAACRIKLWLLSLGLFLESQLHFVAECGVIC